MSLFSYNSRWIQGTQEIGVDVIRKNEYFWHLKFKVNCSFDIDIKMLPDNTLLIISLPYYIYIYYLKTKEEVFIYHKPKKYNYSVNCNLTDDNEHLFFYTPGEAGKMDYVAISLKDFNIIKLFSTNMLILRGIKLSNDLRYVLCHSDKKSPGIDQLLSLPGVGMNYSLKDGYNFYLFSDDSKYVLALTYNHLIVIYQTIDDALIKTIFLTDLLLVSDRGYFVNFELNIDNEIILRVCSPINKYYLFKQETLSFEPAKARDIVPQRRYLLYTDGIDYRKVIRILPQLRTLYCFHRQFSHIFAEGIILEVLKFLLFKINNLELLNFLLNLAKNKELFSKTEFVDKVLSFV